MDDSMMEMEYEDRTYVEDDREEFELNALAQDRENDEADDQTETDGTDQDSE